MRFLHEVFWFVVIFGVAEIVVEAVERRRENRWRAWKYGHPSFFQNYSRSNYPEDLR